MAIYRGIDTEYSGVFVRVWGEQYREELILNITLFVVCDLGLQYGEELILNITVFCVVSGEGNIRGN